MEISTQTDLEWQCIRLNRAFAFHNDHLHEPGAADRLVLLFTPEGLLDLGLYGIARGHEEIRRWALQLVQDRVGGTLTRHTIPNFFFHHVGSDRAEATVYNITYAGQGDPAQAPPIYLTPQGHFITLQMAYRKTAQGWRISSMKAEVSMAPTT